MYIQVNKTGFSDVKYFCYRVLRKGLKLSPGNQFLINLRFLPPFTAIFILNSVYCVNSLCSGKRCGECLIKDQCSWCKDLVSKKHMTMLPGFSMQFL